MVAHGLRKLRVASVSGALFGTLADDAKPLEDYLGARPLIINAGVLTGVAGLLALDLAPRWAQRLTNAWIVPFAPRFTMTGVSPT
jgi:hypothetical protein